LYRIAIRNRIKDQRPKTKDQRPKRNRAVPLLGGARGGLNEKVQNTVRITKDQRLKTKDKRRNEQHN